MDAYEDGRHPPSLHLLNKFDPGGHGSCLKRYSDPTFFKRASVATGEANIVKILKDNKDHKIKVDSQYSATENNFYLKCLLDGFKRIQIPYFCSSQVEVFAQVQG